MTKEGDIMGGGVLHIFWLKSEFLLPVVDKVLLSLDESLAGLITGLGPFFMGDDSVLDNDRSLGGLVRLALYE